MAPIELANLPSTILQSIIGNLATPDVISLGRCNSQLNLLCNTKLYSNILITEDDLAPCFCDRYKVRSYTILVKGKLPQFVHTMSYTKKGQILVSLIKKVTILTSSSLTSAYTVNEFDDLYYILLSNPATLKFFENLDYNNVKKCENFLQYNSNYISKKNLRKKEDTALYENDDVELLVHSGNLTKIKELDNFQINALSDFELIPETVTTLEKLSVMVEQVYNVPLYYQQFHLNKSLLNAFQYLKTLELNTSISSEIFISRLSCPSSQQQLQERQSVVFPNLEVFSMTYVHSIRSKFELLLKADNFQNTIFNFENLKSLELKLNCDDLNCQVCHENFLEEIIPYLCNLRKLSVVFITNENLLANSRADMNHHDVLQLNQQQTTFKSIWSRTVYNLRYLKKLEYLYLNLNDFTFIPFVRFETIPERANIFDFIISNHFLNSKITDLSNIYQLPLKTLILPDFFYNWKIFDSESPQQFERELQFLSYLNKCDCEDCISSRKLCYLYAEELSFAQTNALIRVHHHQNKDIKLPVDTQLTNTRRLNNFRFFYNSFIRSLKQRLPYTDEIFKNQSGLTILEKPFHAFNMQGTPADPVEKESRTNHYNGFVHLIVHNMFSDMKRILIQNPQLEELVFGGIFFRIRKLNETEFECEGVYDEFKYIINLNADNWISPT